MANINDNRESSASQNARIASWLENGHSITSLEALTHFGCMRLASRICDLRDKGMNIKAEKVKTLTGKWVTKYTLSKKNS